MPEIIVRISLPPPGCSANPRSKANYRGKAEAVAIQRSEAWAAGLMARPRPCIPGVVRVHAEWFFGKTRTEIRAGRSLCYRPKDIQNAWIALKGAIDGLKDAGLIKEDSYDWLKLGETIFRRTPDEHKGESGIMLRLEVQEASS